MEASCKHRCLEDLTSTTRFVSWSLHTKSTKALRSLMGRLQLPESSLRGGGGAAVPGGSKGGQQGSGGVQDTSSATAGVMIDLLECTLWQRQLGTLSEETVSALVAQVRAHCVRLASLLAGTAARSQLLGVNCAPECCTPHCQRRGPHPSIGMRACTCLLHAQVFEGIRDFIVQSVELKFNCFFLMPLVDVFPQVRCCWCAVVGACSRRARGAHELLA